MGEGRWVDGQLCGCTDDRFVICNAVNQNVVEVAKVKGGTTFGFYLAL